MTKKHLTIFLCGLMDITSKMRGSDTYLGVHTLFSAPNLIVKFDANELSFYKVPLWKEFSLYLKTVGLLHAENSHFTMFFFSEMISHYEIPSEDTKS